MKHIFISYSHQDKKWKNLLIRYLKEFQLHEEMEVWDDSRIKVGEDWLQEIKQVIDNAYVAILLISSDFLSSDYILREEIPRLLQRRVQEGMKVFPLVVKPCQWEDVPWLASIQVTPMGGKTLSMLPKHEMEHILSAFVGEIGEILKPEPQPAQPDMAISNLPITGNLLLGREKELDMLDKAWQDTDTHVLTLVAWGGVGKTALVNQWLNSMEKHRFRGAKCVYAWSFYSQGTSVDRQTSADEFINDALVWFGDPDPKKGSPWDKGIRLANRIRETKTLLILDGMEPLQYPPGEMQGRLKDQALQALLKELARSNPGLCVVTTRIPVQDLEFAVTTSVKRVCLEDLTPETGAALLKSHGVKGTAAELAAVAAEFKGHALALNLLGRYLAVVHGGEIRKKDRVPGLTAEEKEGGHARRVMESYERFLSGKPELNILYMLGLFDRPADKGAMEALRAGAPIDGVTTELHTLSDTQWLYALTYLRDLNLLAGDEREGSDVLDCHPLVREHFGERFERKHPEAWKEAHSRLYEYYKELPEKKYPETLKEMEPLYIAVNHGCKAARYRETLHEVFWNRIRRGNETYSLHKLGAFGSDLAALSGFFEIPWQTLALGFTENDEAFILNDTAFSLRALGRLREASQPMEASLEVRINQENWRHAAIIAGNLSELYLTMGEVKRSVKVARKSVELADKSEDAFQLYSKRTTLADALHQAGELTEAETWFREAEAMQKKHTPQYPYLYSQGGYQFCDLLLSQGQYKEVQKRAVQTLKWVKEERWLLDIALDHLSLGRAYWLQTLAEEKRDFHMALDHLQRGVDGLREAGLQDFLVRGLLAGAALYRSMEAFAKAWYNLEEALEIAERGSMKLYMADYHLEAARLYQAEGKEDYVHAHLETARQMINEMGYHRRDGEISPPKI